MITFIDKYVSCALLNVDSDPELHDLVTKRQVHHHTRTKKTGVTCRFHFPWPPSTKTIISRPPISETANQELASAKSILKKVLKDYIKLFKPQ